MPYPGRIQQYHFQADLICPNSIFNWGHDFQI